MAEEYIGRQAARLSLLEKGQCSRRYKIGDTWELNYDEIRAAINQVPTADVVPWSFLERYAEFFCAVVSPSEFIREAKRFYSDSCGAMEGGNIDR